MTVSCHGQSLTVTGIVGRYLALARAFLSAGEPEKLYQFLRSNVFADSPELAHLLVRSQSRSSALLQAGLDMHMRLGAIAPLVEALLGCGEVGANPARVFKWSRSDGLS